MKTKSKLLVVGAFPSDTSKIFGGIVTTCQILLRSEFPRRFELVLIDSTQRSNPPPALFKRLIFSLVKSARYCYKLLATSPDAVLLFTATGASVAEKGLMARMARAKNIPVFLFPRGAEIIDIVSKSPFQKAWIKPAMSGATHFFCQGPAWQRFAVDILGFSSSHAPIIYNWSATPDLLAIGAQRASLPPANCPRLLFVGWLEREKGIFELLEACRALSLLFPFTLTIAGRGHAEASAIGFVREHGLEKYIRFVGWVDGASKLALLSASDILVLPSWAEGLPNAMIEAMAANLAVVVSSVGIVPDLISDEVEALLVPPRDVNLLRYAIQRLLVDSVFRDQLASRGHEFARTHFAVDPAIERLTLIIDRAIAESKSQLGAY